MKNDDDMSGFTLLVCGMQIDHSQPGSLGGVADRLVAPIVQAARQAAYVVGLREWHPADHVSFAARHLWRKPGQQVVFGECALELQPIHCVQGTFGARWLPGIAGLPWSLVVDTGARRDVDHYSAFEEADGADTGLLPWLKARDPGMLVLAGLPLDGLLGATFEQARALGFEVRLLEGGCSLLHQLEVSPAWREPHAMWWSPG